MFFPVIDNLNSYFKYVYDICNSISLGQVTISLKFRSPEKIHNAMWITIDARLRPLRTMY